MNDLESYHRAGPWHTKILSFPDTPDEQFVVHYQDSLEAVKALLGDWHLLKMWFIA